MAKVLTSLRYNEMALAATLLTDWSSIAWWTIFAAAEVFHKASCPGSHVIAYSFKISP
jgi:hypothetical protein